MDYTPASGVFPYMEVLNMKNWRLTASRDGVWIDFKTIIESETEPDFWTCYDIAAAHGCDYFTVSEV